MNLHSVINGIKKYKRALSNLAARCDISPYYLYIDCLWAYLKHGCVLNHYIEGRFYLRRDFERKKILTYRRWLKVLEFNDNRYSHFLKNKVDFNNYFKDYIGRDWILSSDVSYDIFYSFFKKHKYIFIKPFDGLEGDGCQLLHFDENTNYKTLFDNFKEKRMLIEEKIVQHSSMSFNNKSVNTIRIYTVYDKAQQEAFCIKASLRVGIGDSIVDNSHSGGLAYEVDMETGRIISRGWGHSMTDVLYHPGNTKCMLGHQIPYWTYVKELCIKTAKMMPNVRFIGWDVAISEKGPLLIEGNHTPDLDIMEFVGHYGYYQKIMSHLEE